MTLKEILAIALVVTISLTALSTWSEYYGYEKCKRECKKDNQ